MPRHRLDRRLHAVPRLPLGLGLIVSVALLPGGLSSRAFAGEAVPIVVLTQAGEAKVRSWNFDQDKAGGPPSGFSAASVDDGLAGDWRVQAEAPVPTPPNVVVHQATCAKAGCLQTLLVEAPTYEFPDLMVRVRQTSGGSESGVGLVLGAKDSRNFHAVLVSLEAKTLEVVRVVDGKVEVLGQEPIKKVPPRFLGHQGPGQDEKGAWHVLRVQHNTILSKSFIEASFDHELVLSLREARVGGGKIGLVTKGNVVTAFDNLHALQLFSNRPLSSPAPYTD